MSLVSFLKALSNKQKIGRRNSASKRVIENLLFLLYIQPNFCFDENGAIFAYTWECVVRVLSRMLTRKVKIFDPGLKGD